MPGTVRYSVAQNDFTMSPGAYKQEREATFGSSKQSFPTSGNDIMVVESP
jgi:hypothetical protein